MAVAGQDDRLAQNGNVPQDIADALAKGSGAKASTQATGHIVVLDGTVGADGSFQVGGNDALNLGAARQAMTAAGATNWAEFATAAFFASAERGGPSARVVPIASAEYHTPARRPANSRLDCAKIARVHGVSLPHWRTSLVPCVERILEQGA